MVSCPLLVISINVISTRNSNTVECITQPANRNFQGLLFYFPGLPAYQALLLQAARQPLSAGRRKRHQPKQSCAHRENNQGNKVLVHTQNRTAQPGLRHEHNEAAATSALRRAQRAQTPHTSAPDAPGSPAACLTTAMPADAYRPRPMEPSWASHTPSQRQRPRRNEQPVPEQQREPGSPGSGGPAVRVHICIRNRYISR